MELQERLTRALADRYRIEKEIGSGGMATVFLAEDPRHERKVAVKVMRPDVADTLGARRFLREIRTAAHLTHPHILPVFDSGEADGLLYFVMPFVKGESLRSRLGKERQLPLGDAVRIAREIADALAYAHKEGVIHRDVKPGNIMLEEGHAVLADFGVARAVAEAKEGRLTRTGISVGTPTYMSPEQATGEENPDGRSDQYSLGCVFYEMLTGQPPFTAARVEAVVRQHLTAEPPPVTRRRASVPAGIAQAVARSLAKTPADRFPTLEAFGTALAEGESAASAASGDRPWWQVLLIHAVAASVLVVASRWLTDAVGLPAWFPSAAGLICVAALPLVLATALLQRGTTPSSSAGVTGVRTWLTWRTVGLAVAVAFALLATGTGGYLGMRTLGIGPFGTLIAQGVMQHQARVLVADFSSSARDSLTAAALSEAIRVDLAQSDAIRVVDVEEIQPTLRMMELPRGTALTPAVAREAAVREGIPVLLVGELTPVGSAYQLTARLVDPEGGTVFLPLRVEARDEDDLLDAVDRLVGRLRERMGERLRNVQNRPPLQYVTTSSLEALRDYTEAQHAADMVQDFPKALALLEEALALDSTFAEAWRKLGVVLNNMGTDEARKIEAFRRAYLLSDRLPDLERLQAQAAYYVSVEGDRRKAVEISEVAVARYPEDGPWTNLGYQYRQLGEYEKGRDAFLEAVKHEVSSLTTTNLIIGALTVDDLASARMALELRKERLPENPSNALWEGRIALADGGRAEARRMWSAARDSVEGDAARTYLRSLAYLDAGEGRVRRAQAELLESSRLALASGDTLEALYDRLALVDFDVYVLDRPDRARVHLAEAMEAIDLESMPPIDRPHLDLARLEASAGLPERAREQVREWATATPEKRQVLDEGWVLLARGLIAQAEGRTSEGLDDLRRALGPLHRQPAAEGELARAYDRAGMPDSALVAFHRYLDAPGYGRFESDACHLARAYERLGRLHEARGERSDAVHWYMRLTSLWADADPELTPGVDAARRAVERLLPDMEDQP